METEGQICQRVGGGRSFWLLCVVVVFCVVARDLGTYVGVEFFVREKKCFMVEQKFYPWCYYRRIRGISNKKGHGLRKRVL